MSTPRTPRTPEQQAAIAASVERMKKTLPWVREQKKTQPRNQVNEGVCPICSKRIKFTISGYNGHMHASCETPNCVNFME